MKIISALFLLLIPIINSFAQIEIVKDKKPRGRIILNNNDTAAANLLNRFIEKITTTTLPVINNSQSYKKGDIIISGNNKNDNTIREDGFKLTSNDEYFQIIGGIGNGAINGTIAVLEDYLGVRYYAANALVLSEKKNLLLPVNINRIENPSFRYRQTQAYSLQ